MSGIASKHLIGVKITVPASVSSIGWGRMESAILSFPNVPVRLAGLLPEDGRTVVTFGITLGTAEEITAQSERTLEATALVARLITDFANMDAAFCAIPEPDSYEAEFAAQYLAQQVAATATGGLVKA